jgi:protein-disulfide isomerase
MTSTSRFLPFIATALVLASLVLPLRAAGFSPEQKAEFESLVRSYLLANPEILREMSEALDIKERKAAELARTEGLKTNAKAVFNLPGDASFGNPDGDVIVVEFMDYNCSWCKKSVVEVAELAAKDKNIRFVMKEFPIFGAGSEYAARAALAAVKQAKYWDLHQAMFKHDGQVTAEVVDQIAAELGLDVARLKADMEDPKIAETMAANQALGQALAITGTPAFIIDSKIIPGYVPLASLEEAVIATRANGCRFC